MVLRSILAVWVLETGFLTVQGDELPSDMVDNHRFGASERDVRLGSACPVLEL